MKNYEKDCTKFEQEFDEFISGLKASIQEDFKIESEKYFNQREVDAYPEHAQRVIDLINECMEQASKSRAIPDLIFQAFNKGFAIVLANDNIFHDYYPTFWKTISESMEEELDKDFECGDYERECEPYYDDDVERECESLINALADCTDFLTIEINSDPDKTKE
jgi:hypothetical protein